MPIFPTAIQWGHAPPPPPVILLLLLPPRLCSATISWRQQFKLCLKFECASLLFFYTAPFIYLSFSYSLLLPPFPYFPNQPIILFLTLLFAQLILINSFILLYSIISEPFIIINNVDFTKTFRNYHS